MSDNNQNEPALGPDVMAHLGQELRQLYADIIAEGVPKHLAEILRRLDEANDEGNTR